MKRKNKDKNKETKKILIIIAAVAMIIAIIGGATFAYWSWQSNTAEKTNVNVTVAGGSLVIEGGAATNTGNNAMYPTGNCVKGLRSPYATVTATNQTATPMTVRLYLRLKLKSNHGTLSAAAKSHLKWAAAEVTYNEDGLPNDIFALSCTLQPVKLGTFETVSSTGTDIDTGLTFTVPSGTVVEKKYQIVVWLDETYNFTNTGSNVTDPMQDLEITAQWSNASVMTQQPQS